MSGWKLYKASREEDGSNVWSLDEGELKVFKYHSTRNLYDYYGWNRTSLETAMGYDAALAILADHFDEQLTEEQLDKREGKSWRFHIAFAHEVLALNDVITSFDIEEWIEYKTKQFSEEDELIAMLKNLSLPILISKSNNDLDQYVWSFLDGKGIGYTFSDALKNALEFNMFKVRNHKIFR